MRVTTVILTQAPKEGSTEQSALVLRRTWYLLGFIPVWRTDNLINVRPTQ